jgi:hypothetical protein
MVDLKCPHFHIAGNFCELKAKLPGVVINDAPGAVHEKIMVNEHSDSTDDVLFIVKCSIAGHSDCEWTST